MVHIGCGADVIRQRRRNEELRKQAEALGICPGPKDFKPAKNKKFPHFTPARDKDVFNGRKCSHMRSAVPSAGRKMADSGSGCAFSRGSSIESRSSESSATSTRSANFALGRSLLAASISFDRRHSASKLSEIHQKEFNKLGAKNFLLAVKINSLSDQSRSSVTPSPSGSSRKSSLAQLDQPAKQASSREKSVKATLYWDQLVNPALHEKPVEATLSSDQPANLPLSRDKPVKEALYWDQPANLSSFGDKPANPTGHPKSVTNNAESSSNSKDPSKAHLGQLSKKISLGKIGRQNAIEVDPTKSRRKSESFGPLGDPKVNNKGAVEIKGRDKAKPKLCRQASSLDENHNDNELLIEKLTVRKASPDSASMHSTSIKQTISPESVASASAEKVKPCSGLRRKLSFVSYNPFKIKLKEFRRKSCTNEPYVDVKNKDVSDAEKDVTDAKKDVIDAEKDVSDAESDVPSSSIPTIFKSRRSSDVIDRRHVKPVNLNLTCSNQNLLHDCDTSTTTRRHSLAPACYRTLSRSCQASYSQDRLPHVDEGAEVWRNPCLTRNSSGNLSMDEPTQRIVMVEADVHLRFAECEDADVISGVADIDPVLMLENDIAQFKDFRLPNHIATLEDI